VAAVSFSIDGFVLGGVAEDWANATGPQKAALLERAETLEFVDRAFFSVAIVGLFGVTQLLYGFALSLSTSYPKWIGATAIGGGVAGLISGTWMWLSGDIGVGNFLVFFTITSVALGVALLAASVLLLRRSRGEPDLATL
jgi:hypothetical protein